MQRTNALEMRQNLGAVLTKLQKTGEPVLVEKGRLPVAVLISLSDYRKRFVDMEADSLRRQIVEEIKASQIRLPKDASSLDMIRDLRAGR
jgi:prevent-host-death family protein